jgi:uncharacterized protein YbjT (DUF2867 family)
MSKLVLVTGASGYVASRLIPSLLSKGYQVRCLVRSREKLRNRPWLEKVEVFVGDVMDEESLFPALQGVQTAYYLIHNMASGGAYRENERIGAKNFGRAASSCGLDHIIFLGGLGGSKENRHMQSRQETGKLLRDSGVPVTEFRSSIIIGSGSISFELIRYLTTWFPFIPAPVRTNQPGQPIGIKDLLDILTSELEEAQNRGEIIEIGGQEIINYPDLMAQFAKSRGLHRPKIEIPFFPVSLSARIADLLTPVPYQIAYPLMQELEAPSVVRAGFENKRKPDSRSLNTYADSLHYAICRAEYGDHLPWLGTLSTKDPLLGAMVRTVGEGFILEYREAHQANLSDLGRKLLNAEFEDNWGLDDFQPNKWIRIKRDLGRVGKLYIEVQSMDDRLIQLALFEPKGMIGNLWWYCLLPFHSFHLKNLFRKITEEKRI